MDNRKNWTAKLAECGASGRDCARPGHCGVGRGWFHPRSRSFFLTRTATSHNFLHINEAGRLAAQLLKE